MKNARVFDVLILYNHGTAMSAGDKTYTGRTPFPVDGGNANYNDAYHYMLESCHERGLTAAFSTTADIIGPGKCSSFWTYNQGSWTRNRRSCYSEQIFDKFTPTEKENKLEHALLFSSIKIRPFNDPYTAQLFRDKNQTYQDLQNFAIPTVAIVDSSKDGIEQSIQQLRAQTNHHNHPNDFTDSIILKDRFGAGGNNVFKVSQNHEAEVLSLVQENSSLSFIIQPFAKFEKGYRYQNVTAATDIRLIYQNGQLLQTYIRMAKTNDFRCNEHQGGTLKYINKEDIPVNVLLASQKIVAQIENKHSLFALDFIVSDEGNAYLIEGNTGPGLDWNLTVKKHERMSKALINSIVYELAARVHPNYHSSRSDA